MRARGGPSGPTVSSRLRLLLVLVDPQPLLLGAQLRREFFAEGLPALLGLPPHPEPRYARTRGGYRTRSSHASDARWQRILRARGAGFVLSAEEPSQGLVHVRAKVANMLIVDAPGDQPQRSATTTSPAPMRTRRASSSAAAASAPQAASLLP